MQAFLSSHQHVLVYLRQFISSIATLAVVIAIFVPLEALFAVRKARVFYPGWSVNLGWYFINALAPILLLGPPVGLIAWMVHAVLPASFTGAAATLPLWARMVLAMI